MATIHKRFKIDAPVEQVWVKMADLSGVHALFGMLDDAEMEGNSRICKINGGGTLKELIVSVNPDLKRLAYSIIQSPFGFDFHSASWQAIEDGDGTTFEWYTDVKPDEMAGMLDDIIENEKDNIVRGLAS